MTSSYPTEDKPGKIMKQNSQSSIIKRKQLPIKNKDQI
jgi:hypothetical protein